MKTFRDQGVEGLKLKSKGWPSMSKKPNIRRKRKKKSLH